MAITGDFLTSGMSLDDGCCDDDEYETYPEAPTGVVDGINTEFTLSYIPAHPQALILSLNGRVLEFGIDYVVLGKVIYMTFPPSLGSELYALYKRADTVSVTKTPVSAILSASADGIQTRFSLPSLPEYNMEVIITINGGVQTRNVDYTLTGQAVVFSGPPAVGSEIHAYYDFFPNLAVATAPLFERVNGLVDGINTTFTMNFPPAGDATVILFINAGVQYRDTDYTVSGITITTTSPPAIGSVLFVFYYVRDGQQEAGYDKKATREETTSTLLTIYDYYLGMDATTGLLRATLPLANTCPGKEWVIGKDDGTANIVRIATTNGEFIGSGVATTYDITVQDDNLRVISNGIRFKII